MQTGKIWFRAQAYGPILPHIGMQDAGAPASGGCRRPGEVREKLLSQPLLSPLQLLRFPPAFLLAEILNSIGACQKWDAGMGFNRCQCVLPLPQSPPKAGRNTLIASLWGAAGGMVFWPLYQQQCSTDWLSSCWNSRIEPLRHHTSSLDNSHNIDQCMQGNDIGIAPSLWLFILLMESKENTVLDYELM